MRTTDRRLRKKRAGRVGGLMCFAGILAMAGQWTGPVTARVERVVDGDTRVGRYPGGHRTVRLIGVDTPESVHPTEPVEHFGLEAASFARSRLDGQAVRLVVDRTGATVDAYGRLLRLVYLDGGENFDATLIREGYGHAMRGFDYSMRRDFIALENQARIQRRGLMGTAPGRVRPNTKYWGLPFRLAAVRAVSRNPGTRYWESATFYRAAPWHGALPTPGRAKEPRLGGCANRVFAPPGVSAGFRRCAACRWRGPWPGAPLPPEGQPAPRGLSVEVLYAGAGLSPPAPWLSPSHRVCLCRLAL